MVKYGSSSNERKHLLPPHSLEVISQLLLSLQGAKTIQIKAEKNRHLVVVLGHAHKILMPPRTLPPLLTFQRVEHYYITADRRGELLPLGSVGHWFRHHVFFRSQGNFNLDAFAYILFLVSLLHFK